MEAKSIFLAFIIAALSFTSCTTKQNFDFNLKVVPQTNYSVTNPNGMNKVAEVLTNRLINFFGIPQENIKLDVTENQILLTLHNIDTSKIYLIKNVITGTSKLEFWETYENSEIIGYLYKANNILHDLQTHGSTHKVIKQSKSDVARRDVVETAEVDTRKQFTEQDPFFKILGQRVTSTGQPLPSSMIGIVDGKDTSQINKYLKMDQIKAVFPKDLKFYWSSKPFKHDPANTLYGLHAIKVTTNDKKAPLDGSSVISANVTAGSTKKAVKIGLSMDSDGAKTWAKITRENISRCIAVVYNGSIRSYPRVQAEISGGKTEITGDFTFEEANDLANILKSGQLPFELKIVEEQIIKR